MDIIFTLPGCDRQAADAVSSYTQVKMEDAHNSLKIPKSEWPDIWIRLPRHKWPKSWSSMEDPVVLLERNLYGHPLAGLLWKRQFEKILLKHGWEKIPNWECLFVHGGKGFFLSVYVDDIKLAGKKQNINTMWKVLNKEVDLGEPTSFVDHIKDAKILWTVTEPCLNREFPRSELKNSHTPRIFVFLHGLLWLVMQRSVWNDIVSWRTRRRNNSTKYRLLALMTIISKKVGELSQVCSSILLKCFFVPRIGRPDILWSVNKLARSITKWTKACDKRLNRLISYIHHTCEYEQYCHVGNTVKQCRLGLFQDSDFAGDLEDSKSTSGGTYCVSGVGCVRNKLQFRTGQQDQGILFFGCRNELGWYSRT